MARLSGERAEWFEILDDPDLARVKIKHLKKGELNDIEDQVELYQTMLRPDDEGKMRQEVRVNPAKGDKRYAYLCAAVVDWENVFGVDGKPMDCTDANKILLARDDESFGVFVGKSRNALAELVATEREAARKNLKA